MLRLIALALIPFALVAGNAVAAKGGPAPGVSVGWDGTVDASSAVRYVALPAAKTTTVAAVRTSDGRVLRYATIRGALRDSARRVRRYGRRDLQRRQDARARRPRSRPESDALRRPQHRDPPAEEGHHASRPLGLRRPLAERPDALRDPVPRHRSERALQRPRGQPRHREAGWRRDHRPARAGRADERLALGAHAELRTAPGRTRSTRSRTGPGSSTHSTLPSGARSASTCRGARACSASRRCACRSRTAAARSSWRSRGGNRLAVVDTTTFKVTAFAKP